MIFENYAAGFVDEIFEVVAGFADRFDRKKILMFFYVGFLFGTLLCGLATNFHFLL